AEGACHCLASGLLGIELQCIGDAESCRIAMDQSNLIARLKLSFLHDRKVNPRAAARDKSVDDFIVIKFCRKLEARHSRLGDLEDCGSDAEPISDVHG